MASPPGLDLDALATFLRSRGVDCSVLQGEVIAGGRSNLTYSVRDDTHRWVVRRPPLAHVLPTAHDMAREWRVISALNVGTDIPVPAPVAFCEDPAVLGAPFYVMDFVDGHVVRDSLPPAWPHTIATRQAMAEALVDTLLALHAVEPAQVGLDGFGHPEGFLERQVRRWWQQWEASKTRDLPAIEELHRRLTAGVPRPRAPGIVHGDYRFDNVIFDTSDAARIAAVVDWEMSTIGDPLCDLGLLVVYWVPDPDGDLVHVLPGTQRHLGRGFPTAAEMVARYAAGSARDLTGLEWYVALGHYKLAIIAEGIHARFLLGMTVGEGFETMGAAVPVIVERALERATASGLAGLTGGD